MLELRIWERRLDAVDERRMSANLRLCAARSPMSSHRNEYRVDVVKTNTEIAIPEVPRLPNCLE